MKRVMDVVFGAGALLAFLPLIAVLALSCRVAQGSPVLFRQVRPGLGGRPFEVFKFRTMTDARGAGGELLPDEQRKTWIGTFLRGTSLDELPQLWNVVRGEMSLVGPRPLLMSYLPLYSERQRRRHEVRPGITGWAQVNGRNTVAWPARFEMDVWYVENRSLWLDIKILALTVRKVMRRTDIDPPEAAGGPEFRGNEG